jgi:cytochrome P450
VRLDYRSSVPVTDSRATRYPVGASVTVADLEQDPHPALARLRAAEPVSWVPVFDGWLVTSHRLASVVMRDDATFTVDDPRFSTVQVVGPSMLSLDGAEHARHRIPFADPFLRGALRAALADVVRDEVGRLLVAIRDRGRGDLRAELAAPLSVATIARALGLDADPATALRWYEAIVADVTAITTGDGASGRGRAAMTELAEGVAEAAARPGTLVARARSELASAELVSNVAVLLFGGIETTEGLIASTFAHLLARPEELDRVRIDPRLAAAAVEEALRYEPSVAIVDRYATRDVVLGGAEIRERELVRVSVAGANRDPAVFADPDCFSLDRPDVRRHVTFAHGPHVCLGLHLARLEAEAAVRGALSQLPGLRLDPERPSVVRGLVFRKPRVVGVLWDAGATLRV